jgi:hypothetical protein
MREQAARLLSIPPEGQEQDGETLRPDGPRVGRLASGMMFCTVRPRNVERPAQPEVMVLGRGCCRGSGMGWACAEDKGSGQGMRWDSVSRLKCLVPVA